MNVAPGQIRAARALLGLEQSELARRAHVSVVTIRRIEATGVPARVTEATSDQVRQTLEQAGAEFILNGVRLRETPSPKASDRLTRMREISRRSAERLRGGEQMTEADLYDENGVPA